MRAQPSWHRHICPRPDRKNQISSTVRWVTARDTWPGASAKCAIPPPESPSSTLTSDPSGATASRAAGSSLVANRTAYPIGGRRLCHSVPRSYAAATRSTVASSKYRPTNCTDSGRPPSD
jgi:hypothetical protein